jgi:hypothetical protein
MSPLKRRVLIYVSMILILVFISGCKKSAEVKIDSKNPPTITIAGDGIADWIWVYGPYRNESAALPPLIWKIDVVSPAPSVTEVLPFTYGQVPSGFRQTVPNDGRPAPPLVEGEVYMFQLVTRGNNSPIRYVIVRNGEVLEYNRNAQKQ